ncbi:MAG: hypothetical protein KZQ58_09390 [gamma proteobacterium symbiont of Bathyaustriella thionipta]|nr:hypothetical protein [gamma proteobacterium symbiont of Bathyaustriella thionipta]
MTTRKKPAHYIQMRLYDDQPDHQKIIHWLNQLPRDARGRSRITEGFLQLIKAHQSTTGQRMEAEKEAFPVPPKSPAKVIERTNEWDAANKPSEATPSETLDTPKSASAAEVKGLLRSLKDQMGEYSGSDDTGADS